MHNRSRLNRLMWLESVSLLEEGYNLIFLSSIGVRKFRHKTNGSTIVMRPNSSGYQLIKNGHLIKTETL